MDDVLICGAGPAGALAAIVLARAGARVRLLDRAQFPRPKLCGDTINPGAVSVLRRLGLDAVLEGGLPIDGMIVTAEPHIVIDVRYCRGLRARALSRAVLDERLVRTAVKAGAALDEGMLVQAPLMEGDRVVGFQIAGRAHRPVPARARLCIAADGASSRTARFLRLSRHAVRPRRWAVGAYFAEVGGLTSCGEMHVRARGYIGVAPLPGGVTNACVVTSDRRLLRDPGTLLTDTLRRDPVLGERFTPARIIERPVCLGPLAVDNRAAGLDGLLLCGDSAGFIDPMTGDGLRFALRGAELAAAAALRALEHGWDRAHERLQRQRRREFARKWRFNRLVRALVGCPPAVRVVARGTSVSPAWLHRAVYYAGDLGIA